jgi:hypothetical protein
MSHCLNCQKSLTHSDQYCAACGQPTFDLQQSLIKILHHITHELLDIDGRLMRTFKALLFKPGYISQQYQQGKRVSYTPPLRMYLVTSLILFFMTSLLKTPTSGVNIQVSMLLLPPGLLEQIPKMMFLFLPISAILLQLFHRKTHYIFNLVFAVHVHIFCYLLIMALLPLYTLTTEFAIVGWIQNGLFLYLLVYPLLAIKRFYQHSWLKSLLLTTVIITLYLALIGLIFEAYLAMIYP